jgi:hypothetical protein
MTMGKRLTDGDLVETVLHLTKALSFIRDRRVVEYLRRSILLLEPLVDRSPLSREGGCWFEGSSRHIQELCP